MRQAGHVDDARGAGDEVGDFRRRAAAIPLEPPGVESIQGAIDRVVEEFRRIDVLVNNAGVNILRDAIDVAEEDWDGVLDVNLKGCSSCLNASTRSDVIRRSRHAGRPSETHPNWESWPT